MASVNILRSRNVFALVCIVIGAVTETTGVHIPRKSHIGFFQGPCDRTTLCEHQCISLSRGYMCECRAGYQLNTDGCTCSEIPTTLPPPTSNTHRIVPKITESKAQNDAIFQLHDIIKYQPHLEVDPNASIDRSSNLYAGAKTHKKYNGKSVNLDSNELGAIYYVNRLPLPCDDLQCQNNGSCVNEISSARCNCPLGTTGDLCQNKVQVRYPRFESKGFLALPVLHNAFKDFRIKLEFRPESSDGLLLFTSEHPDARKDFFSIALIKGHVVFRFDCGTGAATLQTKGRVTLGKWNTVHVNRQFRSGTLSLNDEAAVTNSSKGDYMRLTLRLNVYLGGYTNVSQISRRTGTHTGFRGCVNGLSINDYKYDFRTGERIGDAQFGMNLDECSSGLCQEELQCRNGGDCVAVSADRVICSCPLGFTGLECEREHARIQIPDFSGHSYLRYKGLQRNTLSYTEIEVILKPMSKNGMILYNGYTTDRQGDFIALAMRDGYLEFRFDLGTGPAIIKSLRPLAVGQWHIVKVSRTGLDGVMEIAGQPRVEGLSQGAYTQLTLLLDLYIGGHRDYDETSKYANVTNSFVGCIQSVVLNKKPLGLIDDALDGMNVDACDHPCSNSPCDHGGECVPYSHSYSCTCPLGFHGKTCQEKTSKSLSVPKFDGSSYLIYSDPKIVRRTRGRQVDIQLMVRPMSRDGLLIWVSGKVTKSQRHPDFMALGFVQGSLQFSYDLGSGPATIVYNQTNLFDGGWHHVRAQRGKWDGYLAVDHTNIVEGSSPKPTESLNTDKLFHIGGGVNVAQMTRKKYTSGFIGCLSKVTLATDYELNLIDNAATGRNIQPCSCESILWQDRNKANAVSIDCSHNL